MRTALVITLALAGAGVARADSAAPAAPPPASPPHDAPAAAAAPASAPSGLALGLEVGEPSSVTLAWFAGKVGVAVAAGTGTRAGIGMSGHADVLISPVTLIDRPGMRMPLLVGIGIRYYRHGYQPMSVDEVADAHTGVRVPIELALERGSFAFYGEVAPGWDVHRSDSCTFASGADSICPHAQSTRAFLNFAVGMRWFL